MISRRTVLSGLLGSALLAGCGRAVVPTPVSRPATRPLAIPPLAPSQVDPAGRRVFTLAAGPGTSDFGIGATTPTWGFGMPFGGPTLRARRGEQVVVRVVNRLPETTTVHWHGMTLPAIADGGPHQPIPPGGTWEPSWRIEQPAATLWYHPHPHGATERHVHRGLIGLFLVDDAAGPQASGLPSTYGVDDIPLVVTDRTFGIDGTFATTGRTSTGLLGDTLLVNGTLAPFLETTRRRLRLRLLNASPARSYRFARSDGAPLVLVATDGGLLAAPREVPDVMLTPAERAEVVLDVGPGRPVTLRSLPPDLGAAPGAGRSSGADDTFDVLEIRPSGPSTPVAALPARLPHDAPPDPAAATTVRRFELNDNLINGRRMDMGRIDEVVVAGSTEIWEIRNRHAWPHNLHVHDARGVVLEQRGRAVPAAERTWKDTVYVAPQTTTRLLVRFGPHADPTHPFMYHCHLLYHEDQGMMGQFVLVAPGTDAPRTLPANGVGALRRGDDHADHT